MSKTTLIYSVSCFIVEITG